MALWSAWLCFASVLGKCLHVLSIHVESEKNTNTFYFLARITKSLNSYSATTGDIVAATERLKQELENTNQHQDIVTSFLHDYQLSSDEVLYLFCPLCLCHLIFYFVLIFLEKRTLKMNLIHGIDLWWKVWSFHNFKVKNKIQ